LNQEKSMDNGSPLVVTRHQSLVDYLRETGIIAGDAEVVAQVTADQVRGRHVVGILPLHLAALASQVTVVPLEVPPDLRGVELSLDQIRQYAGKVQAFRVTSVED
jgi:putative CRISPR-associated protein (TIGR02620 family)